MTVLPRNNRKRANKRKEFLEYEKKHPGYSTSVYAGAFGVSAGTICTWRKGAKERAA
jgi:hypothetical protein